MITLKIRYSGSLPVVLQISGLDYLTTKIAEKLPVILIIT